MNWIENSYSFYLLYDKPLNKVTWKEHLIEIKAANKLSIFFKTINLASWTLFFEAFHSVLSKPNQLAFSYTEQSCIVYEFARRSLYNILFKYQKVHPP
jgi:hypothetical protein